MSQIKPKRTKEKIKVIELFAGVGGFRLGLEGWKGKSASSNYSKKLNSNFEVVWSNQFEPATKTQHASLVYEKQFGNKNHSNEDIELVSENVDSEIPEHDLLVGGFPCQDYSVATTLKNSKGLIGRKGVLWWSIHKILSVIQNQPNYLLLENVDRLLKSPASQRGRDFAVMLKSLEELGYIVEWRVVNAAEYGMPQRRRRIFIIGYHESSPVCKNLLKIHDEDLETRSKDWLQKEGVMANAFPIHDEAELSNVNPEILPDGIVHLSDHFNENKTHSPFENTGIMIKGKYITFKSKPDYKGPFTTINDILEKGRVASQFYINEEDFEKWKYQKGAKKIPRVSKTGHEYIFSEGGMVFPDSLDKPSRTIITGEGGLAPSRFKHVVKKPSWKQPRRLTPIELERLNMFPDKHTELEGTTDTKRAFFMGNALVVGVIERIGKALTKKITNAEPL
ncbi:MAG TPA: DNA (cytosine-5-)-methyltransferase [Nitrospinaceae bacterium]|nr:DNA (cytosine-5-)-methyltransferase [Nitrospinaceae bacterium]